MKRADPDILRNLKAKHFLLALAMEAKIPTTPGFCLAIFVCKQTFLPAQDLQLESTFLISLKVGLVRVTAIIECNELIKYTGACSAEQWSNNTYCSANGVCYPDNSEQNCSSTDVRKT